MSVYNKSGVVINEIYQIDGDSATEAYDILGNVIFPTTPVPSGDLSASSTIALPDVYSTGHGFTCTGLAYDDGTFLVGDIGELQPGGTVKSQIVRLSSDFETVIETIPLYSIFTSMTGVQGITVDTSDDTIWFCAPDDNRVYHMNKSGTALGALTIATPTGIAYSPNDDSLWILNYQNKILRVSKQGSVLETYAFAYDERLDQCFLDHQRGYLYITAGENYTSRNNVYLFDVNQHTQRIACTVDSYSVEGIWIGQNEMVILNDGYFHSALVNVNQANIYSL